MRVADVDPVPDIVWDGGEGGGITEHGQQPRGGGLVVLCEHLALVPDEWEGLFLKDTEYLLIQPALVPLAQVRDGDPVLGHGDPGVGGVQGSLVLQPDPARAQLQPRVHRHLLTVGGVTLLWRRHSWDLLARSS